MLFVYIVLYMDPDTVISAGSAEELLQFIRPYKKRYCGCILDTLKSCIQEYFMVDKSADVQS